jgi:hypothetical protein
MVITYVAAGPMGDTEYEAGWQMNENSYNEWRDAIERLRSQ